MFVWTPCPSPNCSTACENWFITFTNEKGAFLCFIPFFLFFSRYDPTTRPWYYAAKSYPGKVTFSVPYLVSNIQEFTKNKQRRLRRNCVTKIVPRNYYLNILLDLHFPFMFSGQWWGRSCGYNKSNYQQRFNGEC